MLFARHYWDCWRISIQMSITGMCVCVCVLVYVVPHWLTLVIGESAIERFPVDFRMSFNFFPIQLICFGCSPALSSCHLIIHDRCAAELFSFDPAPLLHACFQRRPIERPLCSRCCTWSPPNRMFRYPFFPQNGKKNKNVSLTRRNARMA